MLQKSKFAQWYFSCRLYLGQSWLSIISGLLPASCFNLHNTANYSAAVHSRKSFCSTHLLYQLKQPRSNAGTVRVHRPNDREINRFDKRTLDFSIFQIYRFAKTDDLPVAQGNNSLSLTHSDCKFTNTVISLKVLSGQIGSAWKPFKRTSTAICF
jgi:hypothetical protein